MECCQGSRTGTDLIDASVETVDVIPQGIDSRPGGIGYFVYLSIHLIYFSIYLPNGRRIVLFRAVSHVLDAVAAGVDSLLETLTLPVWSRLCPRSSGCRRC